MSEITILPKNTRWTRQCNPYAVSSAAPAQASAIKAPKAPKVKIAPVVAKKEVATAAVVNSSSSADVAGTKIVSPLPGVINEINVKVGDKVNEGDVVLILEAMKMKNNIEAECSGTIQAVNVTVGQSVMENDILVVIS